MRLDEIFGAIQKLKTISQLTVASQQEQTIKKFIEKYKLSSIDEIDLSATDSLSIGSFVLIANLASSLTSITSINLSYNNLKGKDVVKIIEALSYSKSLKKINLSCNDIAEYSVTVSKLVVKIPTLVTLDLSLNNIRYNLLETIQVLAHSSKIKFLDIQQCAIPNKLIYNYISNFTNRDIVERNILAERELSKFLSIELLELIADYEDFYTAFEIQL